MSQNLAAKVNIGDMLAGKYRVERVLGQGAMGMVVAARHIDLHELRAIKFMLPTWLSDVDSVERFLREARACARLKSRHVATVYDVGRLDDGAPYIVMEYLEGSDLKALLQQRTTLPIDEAIEYVTQACEAIGEAHQMGIVHRDLKPANMFLTAGVGGVPCIKVLDFGIAKLAPPPGVAPAQHDMTTTDMVMGSPLYMSPEQMRSSRNVDARADIWSLGVILFRLVTGTLPFQGSSTPELFVSILKEAPPRPSQLNPAIPQGLEAIILRCLEKEPAARWHSTAELVRALRPFAAAQTNLGAAKDLEGTTHVWRSSMASISDVAVASASSSGSVQAQTAPPLHDSGTVSMNRAQAQPAPKPNTTTLPLARSSPAPSFPSLGAPPSQQQPFPQHPPQPSAPSFAGTTGPAMESGMVGQTGGTWAQTQQVRTPQRSRGIVIAAAMGGGFFFAGALVLMLMRHSDAPATAASPEATAKAAAVTQAAPPSQTAEPSITPAGTVPAPSASASAQAASPPKQPASTSKPTTPQPAATTKSASAGEDDFGSGRR